MQQGQSRDALFWALPGGIVEADELVTDGLAREVEEETGIVLGELRHLAYVIQAEWQRPARVRGREVDGYVATIWCFEVDSWAGAIHVDDPDGVVVDAAFVRVEEAIERLHVTEWLSLAAGYLRDDVPPGSFHVERWLPDGTVTRTLLAPPAG